MFYQLQLKDWDRHVLPDHLIPAVVHLEPLHPAVDLRSVVQMPSHSFPAQAKHQYVRTVNYEMIIERFSFSKF